MKRVSMFTAAVALAMAASGAAYATQPGNNGGGNGGCGVGQQTNGCGGTTPTNTYNQDESIASTNAPEFKPMKVANIIHENGKFWVYKLRADHFQVNATGVTHSVVLEAYADESLAVAYCDSLARRFPEGFSEQHLWKRSQPETV